MSFFDCCLAVCVGMSLSAACGFRVFVPLLAVALMVNFGGYHVNDSLAWVGSDTACICLAVATVLEIAAYYIPWFDNFMDSLNVPLAVVAGTIITVGMMPELPGYAQWGIGLVAGGGAAGVVSAATAAVRGASTATTGGMGNCVVATAENAASVGGSVVTFVFAPVVVAAGALLVVGLAAWLLCRLLRRLKKKQPAAAQTAE